MPVLGETVRDPKGGKEELVTVALAQEEVVQDQ